MDDDSDLTEHPGLAAPLAAWVAARHKVRLLRNTGRLGLIRSKNRGAKEAAASVVVFLDAHCEVNTGWLPPLLATVAGDARAVAVPVIDTIHHTTFEV